MAAEIVLGLQQAQLQRQNVRHEEQERTIDDLLQKIQKSTSPEDIFSTTCQEVRRVLRADRAIVYRFNPDWTGQVVAESVGRGWVSLLVEQQTDEVLQGDRVATDRCILRKWAQGDIIDRDTHLEKTRGGKYARGTASTRIDDIYKANFPECYVNSLEKYQARAYVMAPIFQDGKLWGLLGVYQNSGPRKWQDSELRLVERLSAPLGLALQQAEALSRLSGQADQEKVIAKLVEKIQQATDTDDIFRTTCQELRRTLKTDRAIVYRFNPDWTGQVVAESVASGWVSLLVEQQTDEVLQGDRVATDRCILRKWAQGDITDRDTHLQRTRGGKYARGERYTQIDDIYAENFPSCYIASLEKYQVRAYMMVPIFQGKQLWGLLSVYQNDGPRVWQEGEVNLMTRLSAPLGVALQQAEALSRLSARAEQEKVIARLVEKIQQASDTDDIFRTTCQELRRVLSTDRAIVYRFNPDWTGQVVAESVGSGWVSLLVEQETDEVLQGDRVATDRCILRKWAQGDIIDRDTYLQENRGGKYASGESCTQIDDIYTQDFPPCYIDSLEKYQARAYVMVPIFQGERLWGLLSVYQNDGPRAWQEGEVNLMTRLSAPLGLALQQAETLARLSAQAEQEKLIAKLVEKIQKATDTDDLFRTTCQELRRSLNADRAIVYRFNPDWTGQVVAESVGGDWVSLLIEQKADEVLQGDRVATDRCILRKWSQGDIIDRDTYLQETRGGKYARGERCTQIDDIYAQDFPPCYIESLEKYQARAYIIAPIFQGSELWGLLGVYQNDGPRAWQEGDANLMTRLSAPLGVALQQAEAMQQLSERSEQLSQTLAREKAAKEQIQQRAVQLLVSVKPSFQGDLTVRVPVTEDEMGTIADAYNNTIQSMRRIVMQVQAAAEKVGQTSAISESSISGLSEQAQRQFEDLNASIRQLQVMVKATEAVSASAKQVELAVQQANQTVREGDEAMNRTVDGILELRETVAQTSDKIHRLGESSRKITKVVNLIGNFATQTNLLALNAAIEATRAGEYGRGFAVVADEVRSLARQSSAATTEIEKLVQEIQREIEEVGAAMDTGIHQAISGTDLVGEARQNLNAIVAATAQISELVASIANATGEQTEQSQLVTKTIEEVAAIASTTSADSTQIASSFQDLLATARELQASVGKFKVK